MKNIKFFKKRVVSMMISATMLLSILSVAIPSGLGMENVDEINVKGSEELDPLPNELVNQLQDLTKGNLRISTHSKTRKVRFIGTELSEPIRQPVSLSNNENPEDSARNFLSVYGELFGLIDQSSELDLMRIKIQEDGRSFVRFQQVYEDKPVIGGELIVQLNPSSNDIISTNGEILPGISLNTTPKVSAFNAEKIAISAISKYYGLDTNKIKVSEPKLWIYNPIIFGLNTNKTSLVWRMDVESLETETIRELVLVDADIGYISLHFNQLDMLKDRKVYTAWDGSDCTDTVPGWLRRSEGEGPIGYEDVDQAYNNSGYTYDFYLSKHGRDSIDNSGMTIISTVDYDDNGGCNFENAFWNGDQMIYGTGYATALDVVGHELTHGVTEHESDLFYYMQSGAINEAFSDIWGELIELTYNPGASSDRWKMGEDLPNGAIRNMMDPTLYGDPDKMTSSYYYCGEIDGGGVHTNSGVANKAAYLMVDGGTFNGFTVTGMGISKTVDLFYEVQTNHFTSASDYEDLYDCLQQAAINLGYGPSDSQTVRDSVDATEMNIQPTLCGALEAPICDSGSAKNLFFDDMENTGSGNWATGSIVGSTYWYYANGYATSGVQSIWGQTYGIIADYYVTMTTDVTLPPNAFLHFNHSYAFEDFLSTMFDGGVLEYSTDSGVTWIDAGSLFTHNGYDGVLANYSGNPLGDRQVFGGESNGYISSRLDLSPLAGQNVRFRFRIGTDESGSALGWLIDDFRIYTCKSTQDPTNLTIDLDPDDNVNISWEGNSNEIYDIYISEDYQSGFSLSPNYTVSGLTWTDMNAKSYTQRYYDISLNGSLRINEPVGKLDYSLYKKADGTGKNWIVIPFETDIETASELMESIGKPPSGNCTVVNRWNPIIQESEGWLELDMGTDFDIVPFEGYEVWVNKNTSWTVVGEVLEADAIELYKKSDGTGKNWISLPLCCSLGDASELMNSIGKNPPGNCTVVNRWNPITQESEGWLKNDNGTNFDLISGEGYEVWVINNTTWTPPC